jgi:hypothetical protein
MRVARRNGWCCVLISSVNTSDESMSKGKKFSKLAKMNMYPYHLGPTRYAPKKKI